MSGDHCGAALVNATAGDYNELVLNIGMGRGAIEMSECVFDGKVVLITGASSGIGRALANCFGRAGGRLLLVARREERLRAAAAELEASGAAEPVEVIVADLTESGACERVASEAAERAGQIDVLVNNAGVGTYGPFVGQDAGGLEAMMRLNMVSLTRLSRLLVPAMVERRRGWVLNVASMAACQPMPYMTVYAATKAFVLQLSWSLREEVRRKGVVVTCLCPGLTRTEFFDRGEYGSLRAQIDRASIDPALVAEAAYDALIRKKPVCIPGRTKELSIFVQRFLPTTWVARMTGRMLRPRP